MPPASSKGGASQKTTILGRKRPLTLLSFTDDKAAATMPKKKVATTAACHCALCKASSEDLAKHVANLKLPPKENKCVECTQLNACDTKWALYKTQSSGPGSIEVPQEDQCEDCYNLWADCFSYLPWPTMCKKHESERSFAALVRDAKAVRQGRKMAPKKKQEVLSKKLVTLDIERSFVVASEKELKRHCGASRVTKSMVQNIPKLVVPAENHNGEEQVFCFRDPSMPLRRAVVKVQLCSELDAFEMPLESFVHDAQGVEMAKLVGKGWQDASGVTNLLQKEVHLQDFTAFVGKRKTRAGTEDEDDEDDAGEESGEEVEESEAELTGVASLGHPGATLFGNSAGGQPSSDAKFTSPPEKKKPAARIRRSITKESVGAVDDDQSILNHPITSLGDADDDIDQNSGDDDDGVAGQLDSLTLPRNDIAKDMLFLNIKRSREHCTIVSSCSQTGETLEYWKQKISLERVLLGTQDRRSFTGLERKAKKLMRDTRSMSNGVLLKNFHSIAIKADKISMKNLDSVTDVFLKQNLEELSAQAITLPSKYKAKLVEKEVVKKLEHQKYMDVLAVCCPFGTQAYDATQPCLAALSEPALVKMQNFQQIFFEELLIPRIYGGKEEIQVVRSLCVEGQKKFQDADLVQMQEAEAVLYEECTCLWRGLLALTEPTLELHYQDGLSLLEFFCMRPQIYKEAVFVQIVTRSGEEDIARLEAHRGKTSKTYFVQVASAIENTQWWLEKLQEYTRTAPATLEFGPQVAQHTQALSSMSDAVNMENLNVLTVVMSELPDLRIKLRQGSTDNLYVLAYERVKGIWNAFNVPNCGDSTTKAELDKLMEVISASSTLWPLDG
eukprot:804844-Amphidinium_carterae.2